MKLLLISNSGKPLYDWCKNELVDFIGKNEITFISAANVYDPNDYYQKAKESFSSFGLKLNHLILDKSPEKLIEETKVFLVGGGNTYHLLNKLNRYGLLNKIKNRVLDGACYIGASAGANIAGPNILTTNDWNVVGLKTFNALNLVPFNINPHYIPPHDKRIFSGESRDDRIREYLFLNNNPVLAMEERTFLEIENKKIDVGGSGKVKVFMSKEEPREFNTGSKLNFLLK